MSSELEQEDNQRRYKIRSSLKKCSEDVQPPAPRRVSFAANSTVKPFVNDGDHTIWDNTYEEEVNSTNSIPQPKNYDEEESINIDAANRTIYPLNDMSLTCKFSEIKNILSSQAENVIDDSMEYTCQFSQNCNNIITNEYCYQDVEVTTTFKEEIPDVKSEFDIDIEEYEIKASNSIFLDEVKIEELDTYEKESSLMVINSEHQNLNTSKRLNSTTTTDKGVKSSTKCITEVPNTMKAEVLALKTECNIDAGQVMATSNSVFLEDVKMEESSTNENGPSKEILVIKRDLNTDLGEGGSANKSRRLNSTTNTTLNSKAVKSNSKKITEVPKTMKEEFLAEKSEFDIYIEDSNSNSVSDITLSNEVNESSTEKITGSRETTREEFPAAKPKFDIYEEQHSIETYNSVCPSYVRNEESYTKGKENLVPKSGFSTGLQRNGNVNKPKRLNSTTDSASNDKIVKSNIDKITEASKTLKEEIVVVKSEFDIEEHFEDVKIRETCTGKEFSVVDIIGSDKNLTISEEQCDLVNLSDISYVESYVVDMSLMPPNTHSTVDNTQALIDAASSSITVNNSMDQMMEAVRQVLGNFQLVSYKPVALDLSEYCAVIQKSEEGLKKAAERITNYQPPPPATRSESRRLSRLSLISTSTESSNLKDSCEDYLDEFSDESLMENLPKPLTDRIRDVFEQSEPSYLQLIEMEEQTIVFTNFAGSILFRVNLHEENYTVTGLTGLQVLREASEDENPFYTLCNFLADHIISKTQMDNLKSSLGLRFDVLSLLEYLHLITDKCYNFFWMFLELQRKCSTLKIDKTGTFSFEMQCLRSLTWWIIEFKMSSPEHFQMDSLKVTSKWSDISSRHNHFVVMMRDVESSIDCLNNFVKAVEKYFQRSVRHVAI